MNINPHHRSQLIDIIRGLCILSVILLHINIRIPFDETNIGKMISHAIFNIIFRSGYYGVMVFFVISGFLITTISIKRWGNLSTIQCGEFYRLRFARIGPCLLGLLFISSMLHILHVNGFVITTTTLEKALFATLTFQYNWLEANTGYLPANWDMLWSLSVEEMFYLFFPLACLFVRNKTIFKLIFLTFIVIGPIARISYHNDIWTDHSYFSCMDGIAIGCLTALYVNQHNIRKNSARIWMIVGLSFISLIVLFRHQTFQLGLTKTGLNVTFLEIGIAFILIAISNRVQNSNWLTIPFQWFGKNSYEIYLTHGFVVILFSQLFNYLKIPMNMMIFWYVAMILICGVMGDIVAKYFSEPLNQFLRAKTIRVGKESFERL